MTALVEEVGDKIDEACVVRGGLKKDGCRIVMKGVPARRLVVDFDKDGSPLSADQTRCDYLLVAEDEQAHDWVAVLELKRGRLHAGKVVRQLRAGAAAAEKLVPRDRALRFRPVAVSGSTTKLERNELKKHLVIFHGRKVGVRWMKCGDRLARVL